MRQSRSPVRFGLAAAALLLAAAPVSAQLYQSDPDAQPACGAFERFGGGAWMATAPNTLSFDTGMNLAVRPGQTFAPNQTVGGVEVSAVLDRHCGNM